MEKKLLIVVDMQNDFIDGALGSAEAVAIVPHVYDKIVNWEGDMIVTRDTHKEDYMDTREGKYLPVPHCIEGTNGHLVHPEITRAIINSGNKYNIVDKITFGSVSIPDMIKNKGYDYVELIGLCTDICVVSNAMLLKANFPEMDISVDAKCCAGVTPETHKAALTTMKMCQINIIEE